MMERITGKGFKEYDYEEDILYFRIQGRKYDSSLEYGDLIVDLDTEGHPIGIELFGASKLFRLPKYALRSITEFDFYALAKGGLLTIRIRFVTRLRNKEVVRQGQDFVREAATGITETEATGVA